MNKRIISVFIIAVLILTNVGVTVHTAQRRSGVAGVVTKIIGALYVKSVGKRFRVFKKGDFLRNGDFVKTGKGDKAALSLATGMEIKLNESSQITLDKPEADQRGRGSNIKLQLGQLWFKILAKKRGAKFRIKTPVAVASIRGTEGDLKQRKGGGLKAKCYDGEFDVSNKYGKQTVKEGQECSVASGQAPEPPKDIKDEEEDWQEKVGDKLKIQLKLKSEKVEVGEISKLSIAVLNEKDKIDRAVNKSVFLTADSEKILYLESKTSGGKSKIALKLKKGTADCWVKSTVAGVFNLMCQSKNIAPMTVQLNVASKEVVEEAGPERKGLIVDVENSKGERKKIKFKFKKQ